MGSFVEAFCQLALEGPVVETESSARRWRQLSACGAVAMMRMSLSWRYTLFALSMEDVVKVTRSAAAAAKFRLALAKAGHCTRSRLIAAVTSLARARALVRSTVMACSVSSADLRWCSSVSWASMAARSPGSSPRRCVALCSVSTYRAWARACCSS
jgi:hypothetical protein